MRPGVLRHVLLWSDVVGQAVRRDLQFRSQAYLTAATSVAELGLGMIPVLILTSADAGAGQWSSTMGLVVVGTFGMATGLMDCFVTPNLRKFDSYIRRGDLDLILLRPVAAPLYCLLRWVEPAELGRVVAGAGLVVAGVTVGQLSVSPTGATTAGAIGVLGIVGFSLTWANLVMLAFWVESAEPVNDVAVQLRGAGQYPNSYFPGWARTLLMTVAPASLVGAYPAAVAVGHVRFVPGLLALIFVGAGLTFLHWRLALRSYNSASS